MDAVIVTGSLGLVGSAAARRFDAAGWQVVGIDNDMRSVFFGPEASTAWMRPALQRDLGAYVHHHVDIRDAESVERIFDTYGTDVRAVIHTAAQPSHDWAAREPLTDFDINARATLTLLETTRRHCPEACFVLTSTNKVYGDTPNTLPLVEQETRWELDPTHPFFEHGIDESMTVDQSMHSLFGVSKLAADAAVQEYGRYFGMRTVAFRCGCITGPAHAGAPLHGFLAYLVRCAVEGIEYEIIGHGGKQVRDNIHADDLADMFLHYCRAPRPGAVYNAGGSRQNDCSVREAIALTERVTGEILRTRNVDRPRSGDHIWYVSDTRKFSSDYPQWRQQHTLEEIVAEISDGLRARAAARP